MNLIRIKDLLDTAFRSGVPALLHGPAGVGKTALCKNRFPEAALLLARDLEAESPLFLRSVLDSAKVVIVENVTPETFALLEPVLFNKSVLGKPAENFFLLTAREDREEYAGVLKIPFEKPDKEGWLAWAEEHDIHPALLQLVRYEKLLTRFSPRNLEMLSKTLTGGIPLELVDTVVVNFLENDQRLIQSIREALGGEIPFEKFASLDEEGLVEKIRQTSEENIEKFNENLLEEILFDPGKVSTAKLAGYLAGIREEKGLELLGALLEREKTQKYLDELLLRPEMRAWVDAKLVI